MKPRLLPAIAFSLLPTTALAGGGLSTPRVGGLGPNGPTEGNGASIYWNPATMTLLSKKLLLSLDISYTSARGTVQRFVGPDGAQPDETTAGGEVIPLAVDIPVPYLGAVYKINPKLAVGFAFMVPTGRSGDFIGDCRDLDPAAVRQCELNSPVRYQTTRSTIQTFYASPSAAYQVTPNLAIGGSLNIAISQFASDAASDLSGREDPDAQAFAHIGSVIVTPADANGVAVLDLKPLTGISPAFTLGAYYTPNSRLSLGVSYASRVQVHLEGPVVGELTINGNLAAPAEQADAVVDYTLPDTLNAGVKLQVNPQLDFDFWFQWMNQKVHDKIEISLTGFDDSAAAEQLNQEPEDGLPGFALARQFQNNVAYNVGVNYYTFDRKSRVGGAVMYETSAIPNAAQTSASIDGNKFDFLSYLQHQVNDKARITLGFSYIRGVAPIDNRGESIFNGTFAGDCNQGPSSDINKEEGICYAVGDGIFQVGIGRVGLTADFSF
jgi:long-subunit fatty acid transport protein